LAVVLILSCRPAALLCASGQPKCAANYGKYLSYFQCLKDYAGSVLVEWHLCVQYFVMFSPGPGDV